MYVHFELSLSIIYQLFVMVFLYFVISMYCFNNAPEFFYFTGFIKIMEGAWEEATDILLVGSRLEMCQVSMHLCKSQNIDQRTNKMSSLKWEFFCSSIFIFRLRNWIPLTWKRTCANLWRESNMKVLK